jgi:hypothetical protein
VMEQDGTLGALSFRSNKDMEEVWEGRVDGETWGISSSEF